MAYDGNESLANEELFRKFGANFIALEADDASLEETIKALSKAAAMFLNVVTPDYGEFDKMTQAINKLGNEMDKLQNALAQSPDSNEDSIKKIQNSIEEISNGMKKMVELTEKNLKNANQKESAKAATYDPNANTGGDKKGKDKGSSSKGAWSADNIVFMVFFATVIICGNFLMIKLMG